MARSIEAIADAKRSNTRCPEIDGSGAPVDYVFELSDKVYALEHTIIEAFDRQIHTDVDFSAFVKPIEDALDHNMPPPAMYHLTFPIDPCADLDRREIAKAQAAIIKWVKETAADLHAECPEAPTKTHKPRGHINSKKEKIAGLGFDVQLNRGTGWWMPEEGKGRLLVGRYAPPNYKDLRKVRIERTLNKKLPKLAEWKSNGALAILVLENGDLSLTNHIVVADAVEEKLNGRVDKPDEIWFVDASIKNQWTVLRLMSGGLWFPDDEATVRYRHFSPSDLTEV